MAKHTKTEPIPEEPRITNTTTTDVDWGGQDVPTGFENTRPEDFGIPFLSLLQKGSPEVDPDHKDYATKKLDGAEAGMIINTLTREIVYHKDEQQPMLYLPCTHEKLYQEWRPRNKGGGFVQSHNSPVILTKCTRNDKNKDVLPNGNEIITTDYFKGFFIGVGDPVPAIIAMSSTQLKKARGWLNMMQSIKINGKIPPMYSHLYKIITVKESNEEGNWWGWKVEIARALQKSDMGLIEMAKEAASQAIQNRLSAPPVESAESDEEESNLPSRRNQ